MPREHLIVYNIAAVVLALGFVAFFRSRRRRAVDSQFGIVKRGGRDGFLEYRVAGRVARIEWELLLKEYDFAVYAQRLSWAQPEVRDFTPDERQSFFDTLRDWAAERGYKYRLYEVA
jgi:hypothetical protein